MMNKATISIMVDVKPLRDMLSKDVNTDFKEECDILLKAIIADAIMDINPDRERIAKKQLDILGITDTTTQDSILGRLYLLAFDIFNPTKSVILNEGDEPIDIPLSIKKKIYFPKVFSENGDICIIEIVKDDILV